MAYEKNTWQNGDVITKEKLNNMENGISQANMGGKFEVTVTRGDNKIRYTLNKTYNEIVNLINNGIIPFRLVSSVGNNQIDSITSFGSSPDYFIQTSGDKHYSTDAPDGYPYYQQNDIV